MKEQKTLEEKIVYLLTEYRVLLWKQIALYFDLDEALMEQKIKSLRKKGRIYLADNRRLIKIREDIAEDERRIKCFWLVIDLKQDTTFHCVDTYPRMLTIYAASNAYEVFYCPLSEEMPVSHVIENLREKNDTKTLIVVENISQMKKIKVSDAVFCTVSEEGEVVYYE